MGSRSMDMQCWKCGEHLKNLLLPFSRYEECSICKADLHVCLSCRSYDPATADGCREDRADFVLDKDKANFCDFFRPDPQAFRPRDDAAARTARAKLAALFGEGEPPQDAPEVPPVSEADRALAELKRLFGDKD